MKVILLRTASAFAVASVFVSGLAVAQDAITKRKELMKGNGAAVKAANDMATGATKYDAANAKAHMDKIADRMKEFAALFPKGTETGDTRASPEIWKNFSKFEANAKKLSEDAAAAATAAAKGPDAFKTSLTEATKNCKSCHDQFRLEKK